MTIRFRPYVDNHGEQRWRATDAENGRILFAATEGYSHPHGAADALAKALKQIADGDYEVSDFGDDKG